MQRMEADLSLEFVGRVLQYYRVNPVGHILSLNLKGEALTKRSYNFEKILIYSLG